MLSIFPYTYDGKTYFSLKQIAGVMDVSSAILYQALSHVNLPRFMTEDRAKSKGKSRHKMLPASIALSICEDFSKISPKPTSLDDIIKVIQEVCSPYLKKTPSQTSSIPIKVHNVAKRFFTALG